MWSFFLHVVFRRDKQSHISISKPYENMLFILGWVPDLTTAIGFIFNPATIVPCCRVSDFCHILQRHCWDGQWWSKQSIKATSLSYRKIANNYANCLVKRSLQPPLCNTCMPGSFCICPACSFFICQCVCVYVCVCIYIYIFIMRECVFCLSGCWTNSREIILSQSPSLSGQSDEELVIFNTAGGVVQVSQRPNSLSVSAEAHLPAPSVSVLCVFFFTLGSFQTTQ